MKGLPETLRFCVTHARTRLRTIWVKTMCHSFLLHTIIRVSSLKTPFARSRIRRENQDRDHTNPNCSEKIGAKFPADAELIVMLEHKDPNIDEGIVEAASEVGAGVPAPEAQ